MNAISPIKWPDTHSGRLLPMKEVTAETSLHRATIYRLEADGLFPQRHRISRGRVGWWESDIAAFKASREVVARST